MRERTMLNRWASGLALACLLTSAASAQRVLRSFEGDHGPGLAACQSGITHCDRPDMNAAANGKQVVQVTWQNVRIYDYNGNLLRTVPMKDFIRQAGLDPLPPARGLSAGAAAQQNRGPFEPHVVFDEFIGRWIITVTCLNDCVLVSATRDALGKWGGVYLTCGEGGPCLNFDPALHLGYDKNGMYVCGGHMGDDDPNTIPGVAYDCLAVPTAELRGIAEGKPPAHLNRKHSLPHEVQPVVDHNPKKAPTAPAFFLAKTCSREVRGGCQNARDYRFEWLVDSFTWHGATGTYSPEQRVRTSVGSKEDRWIYNPPCCGENMGFPQKGSDVLVRAAEGHRLSNAFQFGTHIYGVMPSGPCQRDCGAQGVDDKNIAFYADLDCSQPDACVVAQTAKIAGDFHAAFPVVGVDKDGNVGIVAASSTADSYLSLLLWWRRAGDPPNTLQGPTMIVAGTQPWTCLNRRNLAELANPAGISTLLDPADGSKLWISHQYSSDGAPCVWTTRIVEYEIGANAKAPRRK